MNEPAEKRGLWSSLNSWNGLGGCVAAGSVVLLLSFVGLVAILPDPATDANAEKPFATAPSSAKATPTLEPKDEASQKSMAYVLAKNEMEARLKAPATAEWPWVTTDFVTHPKKGVYVVRAYVDADNAFGAKLRLNYVAKFHEDADGELLLDEFDAAER